jgi:hypothetical protein
MNAFNPTKSYHGSETVKHGRLRGATDTDYFYFFCPKCPDNQMLRILDYNVLKEKAHNEYNDLMTPRAAQSFIIAFKLNCQQCGMTDFVKISNIGWQGGVHSEALQKNRKT